MRRFGCIRVRIARIMLRARCVCDGAISSGIDYQDFGCHITWQGGFVVLRNGFSVVNTWGVHQNATIGVHCGGEIAKELY